MKPTLADLEKSRPRSKINVPTSDTVARGVWKDVTDVAKQTKFDKVWHTQLTCHKEFKLFDDYGYWNMTAPIFFFALDEADAVDRMSTLPYSLSKFFVNNSNAESSLSKPVQVSTEEANRIIAIFNEFISKRKSIPYDQRDNAANDLRQAIAPFRYADTGSILPTDTDQLTTRILVLPTSAMLDEMKKSADWAVNIVRRLKDQDEAYLKEKWLQTPDGNAWKRKFDQEQAKLARYMQKQDLKKQAEERAAAMADEIDACLRKQSSKYPQFNCGVVPVNVFGGRKFKGAGFIYAIETVESNYGYHTYDVTTDIAKIYCPFADSNDRFVSANLRYCVIDDNVSGSVAQKAFDSYCADKVSSTLAWCREKDPSKPESEIQRWAANIIKKYAPNISIEKYFPEIAAEQTGDKSAKVISTLDWAIGLGYDQNHTSAILRKSFIKKGVDPKDYEDIIRAKLEKAFGTCKYAF